MNSVDAFARGAVARAAGNKVKVFDWNKAAELLRGKVHASAGLQDDLNWTAGTILDDGKPNLESYTYLASVWATPVLVIDGEEIECWAYADECEFNKDSKWPESALEIFNKE